MSAQRTQVPLRWRPAAQLLVPHRLGFFLTMAALLMLAMVTRVSCGHGARSLVADNLVWAIRYGGWYGRLRTDGRAG
jgi:hypothetical protein